MYGDYYPNFDPYTGLYPAFSMPPFTYPEWPPMQIQIPNHYQEGPTKQEKQEYYEPEAYPQAPPCKEEPQRIPAP